MKEHDRVIVTQQYYIHLQTKQHKHTFNTWELNTKVSKISKFSVDVSKGVQLKQLKHASLRDLTSFF